MNLTEVKKLNPPIRRISIPKVPGCYLFKDKKGKVVYVGKAADLRSRVLSYWRESTDHSPAKYSMLKIVSKIDWVETDSEVEAFLLESNLIKKYQPQYNVIMRDDKRHVYIKVSTEDEYPRIFMTRQLEKSGRYFGPFVSTEAVRETLRVLRKIWPYRSCKNLPKKVCLYYRIGKCPGPCEEKVSKKDYQKVIKQIIKFLEGKKQQVVRDIKKEIKILERSGSTAREAVEPLKYKLLNLEKVLSHTNILNLMDKYASDVVELAKTLGLPKIPERIEGYDISNIFGQEAVGSMVVFNGGEPEKSQYRKFKIKVGQGQASDVRMLSEVLERRFKHIDGSRINPTLPPLKTRGGAKKFPPLKGESEGVKAWPTPDLIIVDGAKAQLNVGLRVMKNLKIDIPIIAISKGAGLRSAKALDKIFFPGEKKPLELPLASPALHLIKRVRDEAHRFAITYHRKLRSKKWK